jgi:hypothetical protein
VGRDPDVRAAGHRRTDRVNPPLGRGRKALTGHAGAVWAISTTTRTLVNIGCELSIEESESDS